MSLQETTAAWTKLQELKIKHLRIWQPKKDSINMTDMTSIHSMAKALNIQMSNAMDVEEIHEAAYALATKVAALPFSEFTTWNQGQAERSMSTGQLMSEISSSKLMAMAGISTSEHF